MLDRAGYIGVSTFALAMTALIGAVYLAGAAELLRFEQGTAAPSQALEKSRKPRPPGEWLRTLPPALQNPVRLRIEGERVGSPGPAVTPHLWPAGAAGHAGHVSGHGGDAQRRRARAREHDRPADHPRLARGTREGLGVAFGTSVAGVAASAMLGLLSAMSRRTRAQAGQLLDTRIATTLRGFARPATPRNLQGAAATGGCAACGGAKLDAMMLQLEHHSVQINERLLAEQGALLPATRGTCTRSWPARSATLSESLADSARLAGETIRPAVEATMSGIAEQTTTLQQRVAEHRTDSARRTRRSLRHHG